MVESDFKLPIPNSSTQYVSKNSIPECFRMRMSELRLKPIEGFIVINYTGSDAKEKYNTTHIRATRNSIERAFGMW